MPRLDAPQIAGAIRQSLVARGVCDDGAQHVAGSLVQASLRGVDSHGINLFPHYCRAVEAGRINRSPHFSVTGTSPTTFILDADAGFGHHAGAEAMDRAIAGAKTSGMAAVVVKNSSHFGAAAYFGLRAADAGCMGIALTNADALLKAHGSKEAFTGTNPICVTAPMAGEAPFCLDMATSMASWNKVLNRRREHASIPADWACDAEGRAVTNPDDARSLQPAGMYKGFGLALVVDIFCALLSGSALSKDLLPMYQRLDQPRQISHFFVALDVSRFCAIEEFTQRLRVMADRVRALAPLDPAVPVLVSGDPEKRAFVERTAQGIPIDDARFTEMAAINPRFRDAVRG